MEGLKIRGTQYIIQIFEYHPLNETKQQQKKVGFQKPVPKLKGFHQRNFMLKEAFRVHRTLQN